MGDRGRVVVVGGGVIGCAIARELTPAYDVVVFEQDRIAGGATGLAAGEVTMLPSYADEPATGRYATGFFRAYDGTREFSYVERPSVELAHPDREGEAGRRACRLADDGLPVTYLNAQAALARYPRFDLSSHAGIVEFEGTGFLDPYTFTRTLQRDAEAAGTTFRTSTPVTKILTDHDRITGVQTPAGVEPAEYVVAAAGWRTRDLLRELTELPIRPYRTQCVVLKPNTPLPAEFPMGWLPDHHIYFRPELNGDLLVGGWSYAELTPKPQAGTRMPRSASTSQTSSPGSSRGSSTRSSSTGRRASTARPPTPDPSSTTQPTDQPAWSSPPGSTAEAS